jgi:L-amino acid N-acyltransferase YncA
MLPPTIRPIRVDDAAEVAVIYNHYIARTTVTFEEAEVPVSEVARRIAEVTSTHPWLVAEHDGRLVGYSYASRWHARAAYRHSVETTIYVDQAMTGRGTGQLLYRSLLARLRERGDRCAIGVVALPNPASVGLHEKLGFVRCGELKSLGRKFDCWIDVGFWQLML